MTATLTDITLAARAHLLADPAFAAMVGTDVGSDPTHGFNYTDQLYIDGWVFVGAGQDGRPRRDPTNTGTSAVTLDMYGAPWSAPNPYNTATFPVLRAIVWSDPTRATNDNGLIARFDAEDRCMRVCAAITKVFHDAANAVHAWGVVPIISCVLGSQLPVRDVAPYDGLVAGELRFNLEA